MSDKRYQHCPWYEKLWRRRYQIRTPYVALKIYFTTKWEDMSLKNCWSLAVGISHGKMRWSYTAEEIWGEDWRERLLEEEND